jgi:hypothetical protein
MMPLLVVPRGALRRLPVAFEDPVAELAAHREDFSEEPAVDEALDLQEAGQEELVLHNAVLDAGALRMAVERERVLERLGGRLFAVDVLAGVDRALDMASAEVRRGGVEIELVALVGERRVEVGRPARDPVRAGERLDLLRIAADEDRVRHHARAVLQPDAAFGADRQHGADEMLVRPHASGDAVHDDAEPPLRHFASFRRKPRITSTTCSRRRARSPSLLKSRRKMVERVWRLEW